MTDETKTVARGYFDAWTGRSGPEIVGDFLAEGFVFTAGEMRVEGRDAFLSTAGWPEAAVTVMLADVYEGDHGSQLYEATNGKRSVRIAEHLRVEDGKIVSSDIVTDGAAFGACMAG